MLTSSIKQNLFTIFILFILLSLSVNLKNHDLPKIKVSSEESEINFKEEFYQIFNLGQKRFISSFIWSHTILFSDIEHVKTKTGPSWMYHRLNAISLIDKHFLLNYKLGGLYIMIIKNDKVGAEKIYKKGIKVFNNDIDLIYNLGFLYYFQFKNKDKGLEQWKKIYNHREVNKYPLVAAYVSDEIKSNDLLKALRMLEKQKARLSEDSIYYPIYKKKIRLINEQLKKRSP